MDKKDHSISVKPCLNTASQVWTLYLAPVHGQGGVLPHEARDDVRATRDRRKQYVRLDLPR